MPRNILRAISSSNSDTPVIARSTRTAAKPATKAVRASKGRNPVDGCDKPQDAPKAQVSRLPRPKVLRIQQRYIAGENQTQIARLEKCDRETVSRIVRSSEMAEYIERMKEEFRGLAPDALRVLRHALQEQKDARIAYELLRDIGVIPRKGEASQLPATTPEGGMSRQAIMVANVLLEAHENFGVDLPHAVEKALAEERKNDA
jgi:hypothetical protein